MRYLLILSIILNLWFQFRENIFFKYVDWKYCPNSSHESVQFGEYDIFGFNLLHIDRVTDIYEDFDTVTCRDHTGNNPKSNHRKNNE